MPSCELKVGGKPYGGWTRVEVTRSIAQIAGGFALEVTERWPGQDTKWPIRMGDSCQLYLEDQLVITGRVDEIEPSYDKSSHTISVRGRDITADLADCTHEPPPSQWKDVSIGKIAHDLCKPFGVTVKSDVDVGDNFKYFRANPGDTVLAMISKLCRQRQLLPMTYGDGVLVLNRAGSNVAASGLALGVNILTGRGRFSDRDRHSKYTVKGHLDLVDLLADGKLPAAPKPDASTEEMEAYAEAYTGPKGEDTDSAVNRYRPLTIVAETKGDAKYYEKRAAWEAQTRAGKSRSYTYTVAGWTMSDGKLWPINSLAKITDAFMEIDDSRLIESVRFTLDDRGGCQTALTLVHPNAYAVMQETDRASNIRAGWDRDKL